MPRKNALDEFLPRILASIRDSEVSSFTRWSFKDFFNHNYYNWGIPRSRHSSQVLDYLERRKVLIQHSVSDNSDTIKLLYCLKGKDEFTMLAGIKKNSYYAYYTSVFFHELTLQIPKNLYLNHEHSSTINNDNDSLTQHSIDEALKGKQRRSSNIYTYGDKRVTLTNSKNLNKLGVIKVLSETQNYEYTDLERTLIDISVRPVYSGGVFEVKEAFERAKMRLNVSKLLMYLNDMDYVYPYHQVIGFYLDKTGYSNSDIDMFKRDMEYDFYLTYNLSQTQYSKKWRLYYPKGF